MKNKRSTMRRGSIIVYVIMAVIALGVLASVMLPSFKNADLAPRVSNMKEYVNYINKAAIPQYMAQTTTKDFSGISMQALVTGGILQGAYASSVVGTGTSSYLVIEGTPTAPKIKMYVTTGVVGNTSATGNYTIVIENVNAKDDAATKTQIENELVSYFTDLAGVATNVFQSARFASAGNASTLTTTGGTTSDGIVAASF